MARVVRPQGRRGEVAVELFTDFPERFTQRRRLMALDAQGRRRELHLEDFWPHKGRLVMKFAGVDSIMAAESLAGCEIQIPRTERVTLPAGEFYISDLVGCTVVSLGPPQQELGAVADVTFGAGEAQLLVIGSVGRSGDREWLVPFADEFLRKVDLKARRIELVLPAGMLELDAPLTEEEKREQRKRD